MPSDAFSILMSHRPEGFDTAPTHGVDLTLSGHWFAFRLNCPPEAPLYVLRRA
jgi:hypothetical protein